MAPPTIVLLLIASFFISTQTHLQVRATDDAFTSIVISQKGLDFLKDLLITKAVSSIIPLQLPQISKSTRIPFLGNVNMVLSNITIYGIDVGSSYFKLGDDGIAIIASGTTCNLSMSWYYSYSTWIAPVVVSDEGRASIQVEGLEVGLTLGLGIQDGTLKLTLKDCGCYVKDISIKLDGGASWLYQGMINAFEEQIGSAVETSVTKKLKDGIVKLDSLLQALPKEMPLDDNTSLNVTFVNDPVLSNSSIGFEVNGLFARRNASVSRYHNKDSQALVSCSDSSKMLGISLDEAVFNSVGDAYFNAEFMQWIVDKIPDQSFLNTAGWRFIVPQLYKKYPNHDMDLNVSLSSPPVVRISEHNIDATIYADLIIDVLEENRVIPVACISLVIRASGSVKISGNNLAGSIKLNDFSMSLKWSNIGNLRLYLIQPVMWTIIQTVFLPYVNSHLGKGFPLPIIHGFTLQNAELGGLPMYVASRGLYNLKPPTVFVPPCIKEDVEKLIDIHQTMGHVELNLDLVALDVGETYEMRNNLVVRPFRTDHAIPSQGYVIYSVRKKLKKQYMHLKGKQIEKLKKSGVEITDVILSPEVAFTGDTTSDYMLDPRNADALRAKVLITEATFLDEGCSIEHARQHGHTHIDEIIENAQWIRNKSVLLTHFSSRYHLEDIRKAVSKLQSKLSAKVVPLTEGFKSMHA